MKQDLPEGPGYSPDGGLLWVRDGVIYWEDGYITRLKEGEAIRYMPGGDHEDYSKWTPEKRAAVKTKFARERRNYTQRERRAKKKRDRLVFSAREKITEEEYDAIRQQAWEDL